MKAALFKPARKAMPAIDYVSIVRSVFKDRRAMVLGTLTCTIGCGASAFKTGSPILFLITATFILIAIFRYVDMTAFLNAKVGPTDVEEAAKWELRATYFATVFALVCGVWCIAATCWSGIRSPSSRPSPPPSPAWWASSPAISASTAC